MASTASVSPAAPQTRDHVRQWRAPDGREIQLVVREPQPRADAPVLTLPAFPSEQDARPHFEAALAQARAVGAARLVLPKGRYVFRSTVRAGLPAPVDAHLLLQGLDDLTIDGQGSTLVFMHDQHGLLIRSSRRLKLTGLTLDYGFRTASIGRVLRTGAVTRVQIDPQSPVTAADPVFYVTELDAATGLWRPGAPRAIMPPGAKSPAVFDGDRGYTSATFAALTAQATVVVFHHWYGGSAIRIDDTPQARQAEDIVIQGVTVHAAPGMGILAYGLKRGLAVLDSRIVPRADGSSPISTTYDAIHVLLSGGDILIAGNHLAGHGDDGINLNSPVHPVQQADPGATAVVLGKYSRFISAGDTLAFFDGQGRYLGRRQAVAAPTPVSGLDHRVLLDAPLAGLQAGAVARTLSLSGARYAVTGNTIERCHCHALLAQLPNGLIEKNTFRDLSHNAIRLLTDVGSWNEGVGAINVIVRDNTITRSGIDTALSLPWAAISAYGGARGGKVSAQAVNRHLDISGNTISQAQQACITVASSRSVVVRENRCIDTNLRRPGQASLNVLQAEGVQLIGNRRSGTSTGGQNVDAAADGALALQAGY